ncbi:MAG: hypothetical protein ACQEUO_07505 [Bacillota bacterium]
MTLHRWIKTGGRKSYGGAEYYYTGGGWKTNFEDQRVKGEGKKMRSKKERTLRKRIDRKEAAMNDE